MGAAAGPRGLGAPGAGDRRQPERALPAGTEPACSFFRVTRGAKDDPWADQAGDQDVDLSPGAIIGMVTAELTARKYAGVVRVEVSAGTPAGLRDWLAPRRFPDWGGADCASP